MTNNQKQFRDAIQFVLYYPDRKIFAIEHRESHRVNVQHTAQSCFFGRNVQDEENRGINRLTEIYYIILNFLICVFDRPSETWKYAFGRMARNVF